MRAQFPCRVHCRTDRALAAEDIDEAFLKSSNEAATFGLALFARLDLQLLVVTPLLKLATIEPFIRHVGFV